MKSHPSRSRALLRRTLNAGLLKVRRGIARATRHAAAFLAGDAGSLLGDCWWSQSGDDIYNNNSGKVEIVSPLEVAGSILVQKTSTAIQSVFHDFEGGARGALVVQNDADYAASRGSGLDVQSGAGVLKAEVLGVSEDSNQDAYGLRFFTTDSGGTVANTMTLWGNGGLALGGYTGTRPGAGNIVTTDKVGIGTASPGYPLDVAGNMRITSGGGQLTLSNTTATSSSYQFNNYTDGNMYVYAATPGAGSWNWSLGDNTANSVFRIASRNWAEIAWFRGDQSSIFYGKVGIGTTEINHKLEVAGDGNFSDGLYINGQPCVVNDFAGDSGSGGAKGAVPAPMAGDAATGKVLAASGVWSTPVPGLQFTGTIVVDDSVTLPNPIPPSPPGPNKIHGFMVVNGYAWGLTRQDDTGTPSQVVRASASNLPSYDVLSPSGWATDHWSGTDILYLPGPDLVLCLMGNGNKIVVTKIIPSLFPSESPVSCWSDVITYSTGSPNMNGGSFCTDGSYLYICSCASPSYLYKFRISDWSLVGDPLQLEDPKTSKSMVSAHSCRFDGSYVYVSSAHTALHTYPAILKVDPAPMEVLDAGYLADDATIQTLTDDLDVNLDAWVIAGCESGSAPGALVRFAKNNLSLQKMAFPGFGVQCFGVYSDDGSAWAVYNTSPGKVLRIDPNTMAFSVFTASGFDYLNEIWRYNGKWYCTCWANPTKIFAFSSANSIGLRL